MANDFETFGGHPVTDAGARELIETLQNNLQLANETIGSLQGELTNANTRIVDLQTNLQTTNNLLNTANGKIADLETENDELNSKLEDSDWKTVDCVMYRKIGNTVYVTRSSGTTIPANTDTVIATLPEGYRPVFPVNMGCGKTSYVNIVTDGKIQFNTETANYIYPFWVCFLVN